jgi:peptidoglycan/LPS O-acetylase OafA/YrhL
MPPNTAQTPRVEALDLLRLVAVLGVVLYHFGFWGPGANGIPAIPWLTPVGNTAFWACLPSSSSAVS